LRVGDAHEAARLGFVDGHFGDERDAHPGADHGQQAGEVTTFEDDPWVEAGTIAGSNGGFTEAVAIAQKEEWIEAQVGQLKRGAAGEFVFFGECGEKALGKECMRFEFVATDGKREDSEVHGSSAQTIKENGSDLFGDGEMDFGIFAGESGQALRQPVGSNRGNGTNNDGASLGLQSFREFILGAGKFVKHGTRAWKESFADFGEADGTAEAIEEAGTKFGFEFENLLRERRLRDVAALGGPGERAGVGDSAEVAELVEFHGENQLAAFSQQLLAKSFQRKAVG
jgi:hypothetical protein